MSMRTDEPAGRLSRRTGLPVAGGRKPGCLRLGQTPARWYWNQQWRALRAEGMGRLASQSWGRHLLLSDPGGSSCRRRTNSSKVSEFCCQIAGCSQLFDALENYEHHYNTFHRNVCSSCKRSFPSSHLLDIHILEWHDSFFQILATKQNMYLCLVESCTEKFKASSDRKKHMIKVHGYPSDFRFDKPKKPKCNQKNQSSHDIEMETSSCQKEANDTFCRTSTESMDYAPAETMEADSPSMSEEKSSIPKVQQRPSFSYKVPTTICFGHGSVRGFKNTRKKK